MKIPIERDNLDPFYRYKMEGIKLKIEGRGNGIKTILLNLNNVSYSLKRKPEHLLKFLGYELGSQTKNEKKDFKYIINGSHEVSEVQKHIYNFIDRYVMCEKCSNPETFYAIKNQKELIRECYACGYKSKTEGKLNNLILKDFSNDAKSDTYQSNGLEYSDIKDNKEDTSSLRVSKKTINNFDNIKIFVQDGLGIESTQIKLEEVLPALEIYLVKNEEEKEICRYLDLFIGESFIKRSDVFKYFQARSKAVDRSSSSRIRFFLKSYFN